MTNYKINKNKAPLSTEQVLKHKDFKQVMQGYKELHNYKQATKPLYKNFKFMGFVVLISIIVLAIFLNEGEENAPKEVKKENTITKQPEHPADPTPSPFVSSETKTPVSRSPKSSVKKNIVTTAEEILQEKKDTTTYVDFEESKPSIIPKTEVQSKKKAEVKNGKDLIYQKNQQDLEQELLDRHK